MGSISNPVADPPRDEPPERPKLPDLPVFCRGPFYVISPSLWICGTDEFGERCHVADVRGWGYLTGKGQALAMSFDDALAAQMKTAIFIADAMNAAWNRRADLAPAPAGVMQGVAAERERCAQIADAKIEIGNQVIANAEALKWPSIADLAAALNSVARRIAEEIRAEPTPPLERIRDAI